MEFRPELPALSDTEFYCPVQNGRTVRNKIRQMQNDTRMSKQQITATNNRNTIFFVTSHHTSLFKKNQ